MSEEKKTEEVEVIPLGLVIAKLEALKQLCFANVIVLEQRGDKVETGKDEKSS